MEMHESIQKDPALWDHFCRKEEYQPSLRDTNNRFPYYASTCRTIFRPVVSEYLVDNGYHAEYPEGKPFAVCLTHDIDMVYVPVLEKGVDVLKQAAHGRFNRSIASLKTVHAKKHPYTNFNDIMKLEEQYQAQSSFYFMALDPGDRDYEYSVHDMAGELGEIQDRGWEVGLHGGPEGYCDLPKLIAEKKRLEKVTGKPVTGCRNHFLNFIVPDSWELMKNAGFTYDCSFGYADCAGFRNGMCHPFRPYNLNTGTGIDILEIPLVIMDDSLSGAYMRLDTGTAWDLTRRLIDTVARCHGVVTLLWHNTTLAGEERTFYKKILEYCSAQDAWMTSGEQIIANLRKQGMA